MNEQKGIHGSEIDIIDLVTDVRVCDPNSTIANIDISLFYQTKILEYIFQMCQNKIETSTH